MFDAFRHLVFKSKTWDLTIDRKLKQLFEGLSEAPEGAKTFIDGAYLDRFPQTTRSLDLWEQQFALPAVGLTTQQRRDRLEAAWKAVGGQDPRYIQDTLQAAGFDVYVHEWWVPGSEPVIGTLSCATARNPLDYLRRGDEKLVYLTEAGEADAEAGEVIMEAGNQLTPVGYPLVNKVVETSPDYEALAGEADAEAGEVIMEAGYFTTFRQDQIPYVIPDDSTKWPYFVYIGGETFGDVAVVDSKRRNEFEDLCLKICPTHLWIGVLVSYS